MNWVNKVITTLSPYDIHFIVLSSDLHAILVSFNASNDQGVWCSIFVVTITESFKNSEISEFMVAKEVMYAKHASFISTS